MAEKNNVSDLSWPAQFFFIVAGLYRARPKKVGGTSGYPNGILSSESARRKRRGPRCNKIAALHSATVLDCVFKCSR
jgi:hypothetical protein